MPLSEFIALVKNMRATQKEYFSTRSNTVLQQSKELERKVDKTIQDYENKQENLF